MRRTVLLLAIVASVVVVLAGFAAGQEAARGTVIAPASTQGTLGLPVHTHLFIFIPEGGVNPDAGPTGETPASIGCIYGVTKKTKGCPKNGTVIPTGGTKAIAVVEYGSTSTLQSDAKTFSTQFGLPAPNITEICATGKTCPSNNGTGWDVETSLDVQWAHAMAPNAAIYVAEFSNDPIGDGAETDAAKAVAALGGGEVSNSWTYNGGEGWCGSGDCELQYDSYFVYSGVVFFGSAGDSGAGAAYPSISPNVISAGGTYILRNGSGSYTKQTCWGGSGGGPSAVEPIPSYQNVISKIVGNFRGSPDMAADASPASGVSVYSTTGCKGWCTVGGTSVASPVLAAIVNAAGGFEASTVDELTKVYGEYGVANTYKKDFNDVTIGNNGYPAQKGWDYCTGVGAPKSLKGL
jgi:subtilase family serine protease